MNVDVPGRVRNTTLALSRPLLPLYEAVVNSIQAIDDANIEDGRIQVTVRRDLLHLFQDKSPELGDIQGFEIVDNGVGFDADNYTAFDTADTTYKAQRGGKGNGRFMWLVAFEHVEIESHYLDSDVMRRRYFEFAPTLDGIQSMEITEPTQSNRSTTVRLVGYRSKYMQQCPKRIDTIAAHLVEHCLEFFIRHTCPDIFLVDGATRETIRLNDVFEREMAQKSSTSAVKVAGQEFRVLHVQLHTAHIAEPFIHFCADSRVVKSEKLLGHLPNLTRRLEVASDRPFVYAAYVDSAILDNAVNAQRTEFSIDEDESSLLAEAVTWKAIRDEVLQECSRYLTPYTEPVRTQKRERIQNYVATGGPMYRTILKHVEDKIDMIDPEISDDALDLRLYQAYHELQVSVREQGVTLLNQIDTDTEWEAYRDKLQSYFEKLTDINASDLARYVCHRHAVLDFLNRQIGTDDIGKYRREEKIHQVIFPLGRTSNDLPFHDHNLWILDETLAFHSFLASDKPLNTTPNIDIDSKKEPDLFVVYDKACAFATGDTPYSAISIIEFKRPMRTSYDEEENPFVQVREYLTQIREGKARTQNGRDIPIGKEVPFHCYIISDITPKLRQYALDFELNETPDGQGFYGYKRHYNAYVEVASYTKIVNEAKKRNTAFFEKLGLPPRIVQSGAHSHDKKDAL